jgi:predicted ATPase
LELKGEVLYDLAPLSLSDEGTSPEAALLFVERARAVRADLCLAKRDKEIVLDIVQKLDGIPLAIELAAARMRVLSLSQLCKKLGQSLSALATGPRGTSARHATLKSAIEWSWNLLAPWEQAALAQCSVFRGGFSLEAAAEVLDLSAHADAPEPLDVLASLRDKSLLVTYAPADAEDELRFGLYGSIRDYAGERLSTMAAKEAVCTRHAAYYLCAFREPTAISRLSLELENLLAVHQRAVAGEVGLENRAERALGAVLALQPLLLERGPSSFYLSLLDSSIDLARSSAHDRALTARAHVARGEARRIRGLLPQARADYEEAIALARGAGARQLELSALVGVGVLIGMTEGASAGCAFLQSVQDAAREANDRLSEVRADRIRREPCLCGAHHPA